MLHAHSRPVFLMPRPASKPLPKPRSEAPRVSPAARRRVNLSLRASTVDDARALGLNISRIADDKIAEAVRQEKGRRWAEENREAIEHHTRRIERDGMWNKDLLRF